MKKFNLLSLFILGSLLVIQFSQSSCTNDKLPAPSPNSACDSLEAVYDQQIKPIIDNSSIFKCLEY